MPGQRKRRERRRREIRRTAARFASGNGHWEVLFETGDESRWRAELARLRASDSGIDWSAVRIDILCGRLRHPTTYRLSRFVPDAEPGSGGR